MTVRIDVCDSQGRQLHRPGDDVRVSLREPAHRASLAPEVTDLGNGSYLAHIPLLWPGRPEVHAQLSYNIEFIRAFHRIRNSVKSVKHLMGEFSDGKISEATLCLHFPGLPYYSKVCDLSHLNGGVAWYCGHPRTPGLTCEHWKTIRDLRFLQKLPLTKAEQEFNKISFGDIPSRIILNVQAKGNKSGMSPRLGREDENKRSWETRAPRGYFFNRVWRPLDDVKGSSVKVQHVTGRLSTRQLQQCLANTSIFLNGDSNLRIAYFIIGKRIGCDVKPRPKWHRPLSCFVNESNTSLFWQIHALPFHGGGTTWCNTSDYTHVADTLDQIPKEGNFVVMINLNLHYTYDHHSTFLSHIQTTRAAMERVLERNPKVKLVVRGPHQAMLKWLPIQGGDLMRRLFEAHIRREFAKLQDKVYFLSPWDMTVAARSGDFHPFDFVNQEIAEVFLDFVCFDHKLDT